MSARLYDGVKVEMSLGDLSMIHNAANCWEIADEKREALEKRNAELMIECERQAKEINGLRCELSTRPTTRELQPVTKTAINNAKDVLRALYQPITSEENLPNETVPGDRFHTVYKTLRDLVSRLEQEGLA